MKVLLLSGYRETNKDQALGLEGEKPLLENQIQSLKAMGFEVVTVVSGPAADEQLRKCPAIADGDLIFDKTEQVSLASNLRSALDATEGESCFILPVEIPAPDRKIWQSLTQELRNQGFQTKAAFLQAITPEGAPCHFGFPLLLTRNGQDQIREIDNLHTLNDARLEYHHLVFPSTDH